MTFCDISIDLTLGAVTLALGLVVVRAARLPARPWPAPGDAIVALVLWAVACLATLRPFAAAVLVCVALIFVAVADGVKRRILREPALFADGAELLQVFTHPRFYVPFAGAWLVYGLSATLALAAVAAMTTETPCLSGPLAIACRAAAAMCVAAIVMGYAAAPRRITGWLARMPITRDPWLDTARFGTVGAMAVHSFIAKSEREVRQLAAQNHFGIIRSGNCLPPLLMLQAESFFDVRRLSPAIRRDVLPHFDQLRGGAIQHGLLTTPAWGGYTMRTECLALTGLSPEQIGLDMINPYFAFARRRIDSLAWRLRACGYRTICVHPFDRSFYQRDKVIPLLGFEDFLGIEYFGDAARSDSTVDDEALAEAINALIEDARDPVFVFAITIANHGPWGGHSTARRGAVSVAPDPALADYIEGCRATDRMIGMLAASGWAARDGAVLALYGDHMPILPGPFAQYQFTDARPDYAISCAGRPAGGRHDIAACMLPRLLAATISAETRNVHFTPARGTGIAASAKGAAHAPAEQALNE